MRNLECFKQVDQKDYIIWSDTGSHFRCAEFIHYLFKELADKGITVSFNLFCEKHGKNSRDHHFAVISNYLDKSRSLKS